jgi:predicted GIY-YIG superfamily endonuclease
MEVKWFCYTLRCRNGAQYVGVATDLAERVKRHKRAARGRKAQLKGWRREKELALLEFW